mmetsp:Transcript_18094/g.59097  ORF Transcript_18094/g.59097 Transcript_18094/m.59097 type:complete len:245 (-) Transcript_18094:1107-1841(-)
MDAQQLSTLLAKLPSLEDEDKKLIEEFTPGMKRISKDAKGTLRQELVGNLSTQCNLHEHDGYAGWLARLCPDRPADPGEGAGPESLNGDLVAASAAPRAIFCCFNPRADAFTCHTRGSFDAFHEARASEACVVFMPTRPRRSQLPNYLRDDLPPNALVVLVVEADMFAKKPLRAPLPTGQLSLPRTSAQAWDPLRAPRGADFRSEARDAGHLLRRRRHHQAHKSRRESTQELLQRADNAAIFRP